MKNISFSIPIDQSTIDNAYSYIDAQNLLDYKKTGGNISGPISIGNNTIQTTSSIFNADELITKIYSDTADANLQTQINGRANISYVDMQDQFLLDNINTRVLKSGDTMSGELGVLSIRLNGYVWSYIKSSPSSPYSGIWDIGGDGTGWRVGINNGNIAIFACQDNGQTTITNGRLGIGSSVVNPNNRFEVNGNDFHVDTSAQTHMKNTYIHDYDIFFRNDTYHGIGYYGLSKNGTNTFFDGQDINGPVLYGYAGVGLGTNTGGTQKLALKCDSNKNTVLYGHVTMEGIDNKLTLNNQYFYLQDGSGLGPTISFDTSDFLRYDRTNNRYDFQIDANPRFQISDAYVECIRGIKVNADTSNQNGTISYASNAFKFRQNGKDCELASRQAYCHLSTNFGGTLTMSNSRNIISANRIGVGIYEVYTTFPSGSQAIVMATPNDISGNPPPIYRTVYTGGGFQYARLYSYNTAGVAIDYDFDLLITEV